MSTSDLDRELRLALFAHIQKLREAGGGLIVAAELNKGMEFRGKRQPIWNQQQGIYKPQWLGRDGAAISIQTSYDSPYDDQLATEDADGDRFIYRYRGEDPSQANNRALRCAMEFGVPLLYLVGVKPGVYEADFPFYVVGERPRELAFELMADVAGDLAAQFDRPMSENLPLKAYATRAVRQRLHQQRFRYLVIRAYRGQCTICRLRHDRLLDAAHILADHDERGMPEISNGLALCKIHHSAYDWNILGVDADHRVHIRADILEEIDGPMLRHGLQELHNALIQLPRRSEHHPRRESLAERFERFRAA